MITYTSDKVESLWPMATQTIHVGRTNSFLVFHFVIRLVDGKINIEYPLSGNSKSNEIT